jgi:hypothetical protein
MRVAIIMNSRKLIESCVSSEVRASTSSQMTASPNGSLSTASCAESAAAEMSVSIISTAIEPSSGTRSSRRSSMMTLTSWRATSHMITSPSGSCADPGR